MADAARLALSATLGDGEQRVSAAVVLRVADEALPLSLTVPAGPTRVAPLLPLFHGLANALVERAEARVAESGKTISCRAGCGACCRQPVPVSPSEARAIARLVSALPEARRAVIEARFTAARHAITAAGVDQAHAALPRGDRAALVAFFYSYFRLGLACPFLEAESCSIHPDRPLSCREFLVTSPPANCRDPDSDTIDRVPVAGKMSTAVLTVDAALEGKGTVLLINALAFAAHNPAPEPARTGPELVEAVIAALAERS